jgi:hypothetical protein
MLLVGVVAAGLATAGALPATAHDTSHVITHHSSEPSEPTVVASGLNNPRQLSFDRNGNLYVAEAGSGGTEACTTGPEGGEVCFGTSGSVTKVSKHGSQSRVLTGLPSIAAVDGSQAAGPSDVAALGWGRLAVLIGLGGNPDTRAAVGSEGKRLGTLQVANLRSGRTWTVADLAKFEAKTNPIHDIDSNPVGLQVGRGFAIVADAGGNTVVKIGRHHKLRTIAVLSDQVALVPGGGGATMPAQAVPTSTAWGPDGALYISQLTGFPFEQGLSKIYRVGRHGHLSVYASGLTNVTDLAFRGRTLYAVQISTTGLLNGPVGSLVRVGKHSTAPTILYDNLFAPYGIAIRGHAAYVTTGSVATGAGQVMRFPL